MLRRNMMFAIATLLTGFGCLISIAVQAQQTCPPTGVIAGDAALLCWTNATRDINGGTIPATGDGSLTQTRVQRSFNGTTTGCAWNTTANEVANFDVTPDVTRMLFENLKPGRWCFRLRHSAQGAEDSVWTAAVAKVTVPRVPPKTLPPTLTIY